MSENDFAEIILVHACKKCIEEQKSGENACCVQPVGL